MTSYGRQRRPGRTRVPGALLAASGPAGVSDTFDRADSASSLGSTDGGSLSPLTWTAQNGTWGISSNKAYLTDTTSQAVATVDTGLADVDVAVDITLSSTQPNVGVICRLIDNNNYLLAAWAGQIMYLFKREGGGFTELTSVSREWSLGSTYRVRISAVGDLVKVFIDTTEVLSHTLSSGDQSTFGAATSHGIRVSAEAGTGDAGDSRFDTFNATAA